jgi:hypothetical protein
MSDNQHFMKAKQKHLQERTLRFHPKLVIVDYTELRPWAKGRFRKLKEGGK